MKTQKIKASKTARCAYLYADGHCIIIHQETHPKAGQVLWAEVHEKVTAKCQFKGRIVFHNPNYDARFELACNAVSVHCTEPHVDAGSQKTKEMGLATGELEIYLSNSHSLNWTLIPSILSNGISYQPENTETFAEMKDGFWCDCRIAKINRVASHDEAGLKVA